MKESKSFSLIATSCVLVLCGGCGYPNKASYDPLVYAPASASSVWKPPASEKPLPLNDNPPEMPEQDDPYSLGELIDIALRNNVQTKITWAEARSAAAFYGQSQSPFYPNFTGVFSYEHARAPTFTQTVPTSQNPQTVISGEATAVSVRDIYYSIWGPQLQMTYLIWDFGTSRATSEAARQALYTADWTHNEAIQTLLSTIMTDYYAYLYQQQLYTSYAADVETSRLTLNAAKSGLEVGVRDITDVLQATTQLLQNQTTWSGQQQNVENSLTQLLADMGLPANMKIRMQPLPTDLPDNDLLPPLETLISTALQNRPDLLASEANFKSQQQNVQVARRQFLPKLNYGFNIGKTYFNKGLHDKYNFSSMLTLDMPLFSGFYYRNAIRIAEANKKTAEEQMMNVELNVIKEVTDYHYNVRVSFQTLQYANAFLKAAEEQYKVALSKYKQGTNTILDLVSAQSSLADARARQANGIQQWFVSLANLAYSTGLISPTALSPFNTEAGYVETE